MNLTPKERETLASISSEIGRPVQHLSDSDFDAIMFLVGEHQWGPDIEAHIRLGARPSDILESWICDERYNND